MSRPALTDMHTLDELAAWATANHIQSVMPGDWLPLLERAAEIGLAESTAVAELDRNTWRFDVENAPHDGSEIEVASWVECSAVAKKNGSKSHWSIGCSRYLAGTWTGILLGEVLLWRSLVTNLPSAGEAKALVGRAEIFACAAHDNTAPAR